MVEKKLVVIKDRNKVLFCFGGDQYALAVRDGDALDQVGSLLVALGEALTAFNAPIYAGLAEAEE